MSESVTPPPDQPKEHPVIDAAEAAGRRVGSITVRTVVKVVVAALFVVALGAAGYGFYLTYVMGPVLEPEPADRVVYLGQGWGPEADAEARQTYYYTAQGAGLKDMRYSWFVNLEQAWGTKRFADPEHLRRYGFIVDDRPTSKNPDQLPVGFTRHFDRQLNEELLDVTCAACHTGQIQVTRNGTRTAFRIDGGSAIHAFTAATKGHFVPTMLASMTSTVTNPFKFRRFAKKVLGDRYPSGMWTLHSDMRQEIGLFLRIALREKFGAPGFKPLYPTREGFGRTDALARIANTVFAENLDPKNYAVGDAPVSFPPVWNIWKFDWVQYNASVSQPMARNIGEAMGVGAKYALVDRYGRPLPPEERFRSTALIENLHTIETTLRKLQPPVWPEQDLGPIDRQKAERGKALFNEHCVGCHGPHIAPPAVKARNAPLKTASDPEWLLKIICVDDVGTDPQTAGNFVKATVDLTRTGLTADDVRRVARRNLERGKQRNVAYYNGEIARLNAEIAKAGRSPAAAAQVAAAEQQVKSFEDELAQIDKNIDATLSQIDPKAIPVGAALSYLGTMIREHAYADLNFTADQQADHDGFGMLDLPAIQNAYKPRPLAGIWATPPYLHNGSVPTLYDLLSPADERPKTFLVGSREFDTEHVGLAGKTGEVFDAALTGNSNRGHEFNRGYVEWTENSPPQKGLIGPWLSPEDRLAIIEHLKVRDDDRDGPQGPRDIEWPKCPSPQVRRSYQ